MKYYVYKLIDPTTNIPFYVGKGSGNRAWSHNNFKDGNNNPFKDRYINKIHKQGKEPIVEIVKYFSNENDAYNYEDELTESIGLDNLTNLVVGGRPPNRKAWKPSKETLAKRSRGLKGIPRSDKWRKNLSLSKQGENNPMHGKNIPCTEERRISVSKGKNISNYELYKKAILLLNAGSSVSRVSKELRIGRGVCFRLKNGSHGIFESFPELVQPKTC